MKKSGLIIILTVLGYANIMASDTSDFPLLDSIPGKYKEFDGIFICLNSSPFKGQEYKIRIGKVPENAAWVGISGYENDVLVDVKPIKLNKFLKKYNKEGYPLSDKFGKVRVSTWENYNKKTKLMEGRLTDTGWFVLSPYSFESY